MKTRLTQCVFTAAVFLSIFIPAHVANAQSISDWLPRSVPAKPEAKAKKSKPQNIGQTSLKLRSTQPNADGQNHDTKDGKCIAASSLTKDAPAINSIILFPCCDCTRILLDGFLIYPNATLQLFNSAHNTVVPVTLGHAGPGRIGFALNLDGPYTDTLIFNVNTDGNGNGSLVITFLLRA